MRVLIVEDDEVIASTMSRGLILNGYVVEHVPTAEAASAALLSEQFDLAIVDLGLPRLSGLDLVKKLRGSRFARLPARRSRPAAGRRNEPRATYSPH